MRIAYLDCFAGIAGDMALAALIDAGADVDTLVAGLRTLGLPEWDLQVERVTRSGFAATDVEVLVRGEPARAASMVGPRAGDRPGVHPHAGGHGHPHDHGHDHDHDHTQGHHPHAPSRTLDEIARMIRGSELPPEVRERGEAVFTRLAEAESRVHGVDLRQVHFHEVGMVDSIVDTVGTVYALHLLGVESVAASDLPCGKGMIQTAHGPIPIPAPATAELLRGVPLRSVDVEGELVTPTGAALLTGLQAAFGAMPAMRLQSVGYGAGKRSFSFPNLLRVLIGEAQALPEAREVVLLEANLDDLSPQVCAYVCDQLLAAGALDVTVQPAVMKKGRSGQILGVLCDPANAEALAELLFRETSTLGVRESRATRRCLERDWQPVTTAYGEARVKIGRLGGRIVTATPEYEDCAALARAGEVPLKEVQAAVMAAFRSRDPGG